SVYFSLSSPCEQKVRKTRVLGILATGSLRWSWKFGAVSPRRGHLCSRAAFLGRTTRGAIIRERELSANNLNTLLSARFNDVNSPAHNGSFPDCGCLRYAAG